MSFGPDRAERTEKMNWNNGAERKKFRKRMKKQEVWYRKEGMSEEAIKAMREYDTKWFNSCRREYRHIQPIDELVEGVNDEGMNPLIRRFREAMSYYMVPDMEENIFWWIDEIEDQALLNAVAKMKPLTVLIISLVVFCGYKSEEVAEMLGITPAAVCKHIKVYAKDLCIKFGFAPKGGDDHEE